MAGPSEFELIRDYFETAALSVERQDIVLGIGDDGAIIAPPAGMEQIIAVDTLVAGVHFPENTRAEDIGYRSLAVNLSDLAAMAAEPAWFTLALTLPRAEPDWLQDFSRGLSSLAMRHGISLVGGDTCRGPLSISVQVIGLAPAGVALRRDGAQVGDDVWVSGALGDAAAGLQLLPGIKNQEVKNQEVQNPDLQMSEEHKPAIDSLIKRFYAPKPRVELGIALRGVASAALDISDGLVADLGHILERSGVGAALDLETLPCSNESLAVMGRDRALKLALSGGDDYELCFCAPPAQRDTVSAIAGKLAVPLTCIGHITAEYVGEIIDIETKQVLADNAGYRHFV